MDVGAVIGLATAGITSLAAISMSIYALILRGRVAEAQTAAGVAIGKLGTAEAERDAAFEINQRLTKQLRDLRAARQENYAHHATTGDPGAGVAVDDALARLRLVYPDADDPDPGGDDGGSVPGDST